MHRSPSAPLLAALATVFLLALAPSARAEEEPAAQAPQGSQDAPGSQAEAAPAEDPGLSIRDVDVNLEKVEKIKRRLQGSVIVRDRVVVGWHWEVEVALERTPEADSGRWILTGDTLERLIEASSDVTEWRRGKSSKTRVRVVRRGYLPAERSDVLSAVAAMAAREIRSDLTISPPPPPPAPPVAPKPEPQPEPKAEPEREAKPRPQPPREAPGGNDRLRPPPGSTDPRLTREESVKLVERWKAERGEIGQRIVHFRGVIRGAEGHEEQVTQASKLLDDADKALEDSAPQYLACVALVEAGERVLLSLRQPVNTHHFHAQRSLQMAEKLLIVFTGPTGGGDEE